MRPLRSVLAVLATGLLAAWPLAATAGAAELAPTYQSSSPDRDAKVHEAPEDVRVTFSEPLDPSSVMNVLDECGNEIDSGPATVQLNEMIVGIGKTPSGIYTVVYRAVGIGDVTGTTASSFEFTVHSGESCAGDDVDPCKGGDGEHADHKKCEKDPRKKDHPGHDPRPGHDDHPGDEMPGHDDHPTTGGSTHPGTHGPMGGDHTDHKGGGPKGHDEHEGPADPPLPPQAGDFDNPPLASGPGGSGIQADPEAMLIGLGLALAVGVLGGWLLRVSGGVTA